MKRCSLKDSFRTSPARLITYEYDENGYRTRRTTISNGVTFDDYEFLLDGSRIIAQKKAGEGTMWFYYDANGKRVGFSTYDGTPYYYIYNAMGDIIGMYNYYADVIYYHYDSWGKLISMTSASGAEIQYGTAQWKVGFENPFRYRGYMYDNITQLYYLNSRYYDPETGRFLNADVVLKVGDDLIGTNLYTYCANNPVNYIDMLGFAHQTIHKGSKGSEVKLLQSFLKTFGYKDQYGNDLDIDGDFGSKTDYALRNYQTDFGLVSDGIAGKNTWALIDHHMAPDNLHREITDAAKDPWYSGNSLRSFRDDFLDPALDTVSNIALGISGITIILSENRWVKKIIIISPGLKQTSVISGAIGGLAAFFKWAIDQF